MGNLFIFRGTLNLPGQAASEFYWRGINKIYGRNPNDAEAEEAFRRSVELDPTAYFVHIQLGNLYLKSRSREKCVRAYSEALKYAPEDRTIRSALQNQIERVSRALASVCLALERPLCEQGGSVPQFPGESAIFKVKRHLPELKSPDSENAVKIVSLIFPVIHQECGLRS